VWHAGRPPSDVDTDADVDAGGMITAAR